MWKCKACGDRINPPSNICAICGKPTEIYSNIAFAGEDELELKKRFSKCENDYQKIGEKHYCDQLIELLKQNISVSINMRPETLINILSDPRIRYVNLHDNLRAEAMVDYPVHLAAKRRGVDNLVFGADGEKINYGALNLGTIGLISYGNCCVFLKNEEIFNRVSFLEENSFSYVKGSGPSIAVDIPGGIRALWHTVAMLVLIKHHKNMLKSKLDKEAICGLILFSEGNKKTDRYIEAQICPPITCSTFDKILYYERDIPVEMIDLINSYFEFGDPVPTEGLIKLCAINNGDILGNLLKLKSSAKDGIRVEVVEIALKESSL